MGSWESICTVVITLSVVQTSMANRGTVGLAISVAHLPE
jgi:hypothetical protein